MLTLLLVVRELHYDRHVVGEAVVAVVVAEVAVCLDLNRSVWVVDVDDLVYYLKQTDNSVSMTEGENGNCTWQFYEVKKEYQVVE